MKRSGWHGFRRHSGCLPGCLRCPITSWRSVGVPDLCDGPAGPEGPVVAFPPVSGRRLHEPRRRRRSQKVVSLDASRRPRRSWRPGEIVYVGHALRARTPRCRRRPPASCAGHDDGRLGRLRLLRDVLRWRGRLRAAAAAGPGRRARRRASARTGSRSSRRRDLPDRRRRRSAPNGFPIISRRRRSRFAFHAPAIGRLTALTTSSSRPRSRPRPCSSARCRA